MIKVSLIKKFLIRRDVQLFLLLLFIYTVNLRVIDAYHPHRYVPISIIKELNFDLDEYAPNLNESVDVFSPMGHIIPKRHIGNSIMAVPVYFLPVIFSDVDYHTWFIPYLGKLAATIYVSLSAIFIYYTLKRLTKEKYALYITLIYAFATGSWSISSQGIWSHGFSQFLLAVSIYLLVRGLKEKKYVIYAGLPLAMAVVCTITDFLILAVLAVYVLHKHRRQFIRFAIFCMPPLVFLLLYNSYYLESPFGSLIFQLNINIFFPKPHPFLEGFFGLLISPSRGLFVYSPILIFSFYGMYYLWKEHKILFCYFTIIILVIISIYSRIETWYGGHSWGPRHMNNILPFFSIMLFPAFEKIGEKKILKFIFIIFLIFSVFVQLEGILFFNGDWHVRYDTGPENQSWLWSLNNTQIIYYLKNPNTETLYWSDYFLNNSFGKKIFQSYY